ncbi:MAG TPA: glycosyltransferase family 4 protein [candidate division Zixibacteria bacterium]|nr:glycosyltransferase family 4 protein [candidate division Zixibacteria bacterium]
MASATSPSNPRESHPPLRIALLAAPMEPVPPVAYGGTERVVAALAEELARRGHDVTVFASGDSKVSARLVPVIPVALWRRGYRGDVSSFIAAGIAECWRRADEFDVIHSHVEGLGFLMARHCPTPVLSTLHGRLDSFGMPQLLNAFRDVPLVAISHSQRRWAPEANWVATIHHGLPLDRAPFGDRPGEYLAFVGRCTPEKGVAEAIELATLSGMPLRMAAKVHDPEEQEHFEEVVRPAIDDGRIDWLGELPPAQRDPMLASALATLMLGAWPEPFGLVAIESLACGTPVIARRAGALPEIVEHGVDGFLVDDVAEARLAVELAPRLNREEIRRRALARFGVERMTDAYENAYRALLSARRALRPVPASRDAA